MEHIPNHDNVLSTITRIQWNKLNKDNLTQEKPRYQSKSTLAITYHTKSYKLTNSQIYEDVSALIITLWG